MELESEEVEKIWENMSEDNCDANILYERNKFNYINIYHMHIPRDSRENLFAFIWGIR